MSLSQREKIHYELLEALFKARKRVEYLEAALAHNAAFLGTGIEREDTPPAPADLGDDNLPEEVLRYLGLVGHEADISNYLGREGDDASRPRLGPDAPDSVRPRNEPRMGHLVGQLAFGHPDDALILPGPVMANEGLAPVPEPSGQPQPRQPQPRQPSPDEAAPAFVPIPSRLQRPLRILVAEDDAVNRFALRLLLKKAGHFASCVENGRQAVEALLLRPFDCLITDMRMPVMDGLELIRRVRAGDSLGITPSPAVLALLGFDPNTPPLPLPLPAALPIVALTGLSLNEDGKPFSAPGIDYYLSKPLNVQELSAVLEGIAAQPRRST